jgi:hypothetical protein
MSSSIDKAKAVRAALIFARKRGDWEGYERLQIVWDGLPSEACKTAIAVPINELVAAKFSTGIDQAILGRGLPRRRTTSASTLVGRYSGKVNGGLPLTPGNVGLSKSKGYKVIATARDKSGQQFPTTWYAAPSMDARNKPTKLALLNRPQAKALAEQLRQDGNYKVVLAIGSDAGESELADVLRRGNVWDVLNSGDTGLGCFAGLRSDNVLSTTMSVTDIGTGAVVSEGTGSVSTLGTSAVTDLGTGSLSPHHAGEARRKLLHRDDYE